MGSYTLNIIRFKIKNFKAACRLWYLKFLGFNIKNGGEIGRIICDWPYKIFVGNNCTIRDGVSFWFKHPFSEDNFVKIGDRLFIGYNCSIDCNTNLVIGDDCLIANNVQFADINHEIKVSYKINDQP